MDGELLEILQALGIVVAWAADMQWRALWLPDERVVVLNRAWPDEVLAEAVRYLTLSAPV